MTAEFYVVFDDPDWYEQNQPVIKTFIQSLGTYKDNVNDQEYWLRGSEEGGDWAYGVRIFIRSLDIMLEISSHPPSIVDDIRELNRFICENAKIKLVDEEGETIEGYS